MDDSWMKNVFENLGAYLKQYRKRKNFTQLEFSKLMGINSKYLSQIESKKVNPSYKVISGFLIYSGMSVSQLEKELKMFNDIN